MKSENEREEKAVEALIVGALHPFSNEIPDSEIEEFLRKEHNLSEEGKRALDALGDDPLASHPTLTQPNAERETSIPYAAMHRELDEKDMDEHTKAELEKRRQEILKRIREKRGQSE